MKSTTHINRFGGWLRAGLFIALVAGGVALGQQRPFIGTFVHTQKFSEDNPINGIADGLEEMLDLVDNPYLTGVSTKIGWNKLETDFDGDYRWTDLDAILLVAHNAGRKINLGLNAASSTPTWLFSTSDVNMRGIEWFEDITVNKQVDFAPLPWNSVYMREFDEFVRDLAAHLKAQPYYASIVTVAITGGNYLSEEPFTPPLVAFTGTVPCANNPDGDVARRMIDSSGVVIDDPAFSISPSTVDANWEHWIDLFATEFPDKDLRFVVTSPSKLFSGDAAYLGVMPNALDYLMTNHPSRAIVQTDSLHGRQDGLLHAASGDEYDLIRDLNYTSYPNTPNPTLPSVHETIGSFHGQPFRQGRAGMTVFNHKDLGYPYYIQMWISDCDGPTDPVFAKNILDAWYKYRNMTPTQMKDSAVSGSLADPAVNLYLANTTYLKPNSPSEAFDQWVTTALNTAANFSLSYNDTDVPTITDQCTGNQISDPSSGPHVFSITQSPPNGSVTLDSVTGAVTYTPNLDFQGTDSFRWKVNDTFDSNEGIVTVEVGLVAHNPAFLLDPIARADSDYGLSGQMTAHAVAGSLFTFNVNFGTDLDGGTLLYAVDAYVSGPTGGSDWLTGGLAANGQNWTRTAPAIPGEYRWRLKVTDNTSRIDYTTLVIRVEKSSTLFYPTHDAHVNEASPDGFNNSGTELNLKTPTTPGQRRWVYLKFNLSGITGDIVSAKLKLKCLATQAGSTTSVYRIANTGWTEGAITWNTQPQDMLNGTALLIDTESTPANGGLITFDVTGYVGKTGEFTFGLQTSASGFVKYYPEESSGTANDPFLEIVQR